MLQFAHLRRELFHPRDATNKRTDARVTEIGKVAADAIIEELEDGKKATRKYLSITNSEHSYSGSSDETKATLL